MMDDSFEPMPLEARITPRLVDALYTEAMLLADEARAYFDDAGRDERDCCSSRSRGSASPASR